VNNLHLLYRLYDYLSKQDSDTRLNISESNSGRTYCAISNDYFFLQGWGVDIESAIYDVINVYVDIKLENTGETLYIDLSRSCTEYHRQETRNRIKRLTVGQDTEAILTELGL
jgi:uncharacterized membrane-anchored protein